MKHASLLDGGGQYFVDIRVLVDEAYLTDHVFGYLQALVFELDMNIANLFDVVCQTSKTVWMHYGCQVLSECDWVENYRPWPGFNACFEIDGEAGEIFRHAHEDIEIPAIDFPED